MTSAAAAERLVEAGQQVAHGFQRFLDALIGLHRLFQPADGLIQSAHLIGQRLVEFDQPVQVILFHAIQREERRVAVGGGFHAIDQQLQTPHDPLHVIHPQDAAGVEQFALQRGQFAPAALQPLRQRIAQLLVGVAAHLLLAVAGNPGNLGEEAFHTAHFGFGFLDLIHVASCSQWSVSVVSFSCQLSGLSFQLRASSFRLVSHQCCDFRQAVEHQYA